MPRTRKPAQTLKYTGGNVLTKTPPKASQNSSVIEEIKKIPPKVLQKYPGLAKELQKYPNASKSLLTVFGIAGVAAALAAGVSIRVLIRNLDPQLLKKNRMTRKASRSHETSPVEKMLSPVEKMPGYMDILPIMEKYGNLSKLYEVSKSMRSKANTYELRLDPKLSPNVSSCKGITKLIIREVDCKTTKPLSNWLKKARIDKQQLIKLHMPDCKFFSDAQDRLVQIVLDDLSYSRNRRSNSSTQNRSKSELNGRRNSRISNTSVLCNLEELNLSNNGTAVLMDVIRFGYKHKRAYIETRPDGQGAIKLFKAISMMKHLTKLDVSENLLASNGIRKLVDALKTTHKLKDLNLAKTSPGTDGFDAIIEAIPSMTNLESLNLLTNNVDKHQAQELVEARAKHRTLKSICGIKGDETELDKSNKYLQPCDAIMLKPEIVANKALTSLDISSNRLFAEGAKELADALKNNNIMKELNIARNVLGLKSSFDYDSSGVMAIRNTISTMGALVKFDISSNDIRRDGAKALAEALTQNQVLKELNIASNNLSVNAGNNYDMSGVIAISDAIPTMGTLVKFNVSNNDIRAEGGKALAEALKDNKTMKDLNIASNCLCYNSDYIGSQERDMSGVIAIGDAIPTMGALETLDISRNNLCSDSYNGMDYLGPAIASSKITSLNIADNHLYNKGGIKAVVDMLNKGANGTLVKLDISSNFLYAKGTKTIAEALKGNQTLLVCD